MLHYSVISYDIQYRFRFGVTKFYILYYDLFILTYVYCTHTHILVLTLYTTTTIHIYIYLYLLYILLLSTAQGCPQITGEIITTLNKNCRRLNYLNLSQVSLYSLYCYHHSHTTVSFVLYFTVYSFFFNIYSFFFVVIPSSIFSVKM